MLRFRRWFPAWKRTKKRKLSVNLIGGSTLLQVYSLLGGGQVKLEGATTQHFESFAYRPDGNVEDVVMVYDGGNILGGGYIEPNEQRSQYVFSSILRKYLEDCDSLRIFVPCYGGNAFRAPKYSESVLRNPDPILETISSIICNVESRQQGPSQLTITVTGDGVVDGDEDDDGKGLVKLPSVHGHLMDFDANMDYIFEIPFDSEESLVIDEEAHEEELVLEQEEETREEDFTLLLEPSPSDIELVISFSDAEIILVLPDGSEESFCCSLWDTSSDVLYDSYNKLFDNLKDNRRFVRRMYRALTKKLPICASDLRFVDDIWESIIEEDGGYVLDAKKVLQLEAKYRYADDAVVELKSTSFKSLLSLEADCLCNPQKPSKSCPCLKKSDEKKVKKKRSKSQSKSTEVVTLFFASLERKATSDESSRDENDQTKERVEWERSYNEILHDFKTNFQPTVEPQIAYVLEQQQLQEEEEEIVMNPPILWILAKRFMRNRRRRMEERRRLLQERRKRRKLQKKDVEECEEKKSAWSILSQSSFLGKNWCSISSIFDTLSGIFDKKDSGSIECICRKDGKESDPPPSAGEKSHDDGHPKTSKDKESIGDEKKKADGKGLDDVSNSDKPVDDDAKKSKPGDGESKVTKSDGHSNKPDVDTKQSKLQDEDTKVTKNNGSVDDDDSKKAKPKDDDVPKKADDLKKSKPEDDDVQKSKDDDVPKKADDSKKSKVKGDDVQKSKDDVPKKTDDIKKAKPADDVPKKTDLGGKAGEDGDRKVVDSSFKRVDEDAKRGEKKLDEDGDRKKDSKKPTVYFPDQTKMKRESPDPKIKIKPRSTVDEQTAGPSGVVKTMETIRCKCNESKIPKPQPKAVHRKANSENSKNVDDLNGKMSDRGKNNTHVFMLTSNMPMERIDTYLSTVLEDVHKESVSDSEVISGSATPTTTTSTTKTKAKKPCTPKTCKSSPELKSDFSMNRYINKSKEMIQSLFAGKDDKRFSVKTIFQKKNFLKPCRKEILSPKPKAHKKETRKLCTCSAKAKKSVETLTMEEKKEFVDKGSDAICVEHVSIGSDPIAVSVEHKETMTSPEPIPTQIPNLEELMKKSCECDSIMKLEATKTKNVWNEKENKSKWRCFGKKAAVEKRRTPCECIDLHTLVDELQKNSQVTLKKSKREDEVRVVFCNRMVENVGAQVFRMEFGKDVQCQSCSPPSSTTGTQSDDVLTMEKFARDIERRICRRIDCWKKLTICTKRDPTLPDANSVSASKGKVKYNDRDSFASDSIFDDVEDSSILCPLPNIKGGGSEISSILSSREYFNQRRKQTDSMRHYVGSTSSNRADNCSTDRAAGALRPEDICYGNSKKFKVRNDSISVLKNKIMEKKSNVSMCKRRLLFDRIKERLAITPHAMTTPSVMAVSASFPKRVKLQSMSTPMEEGEPEAAAAPTKNANKSSPNQSATTVDDDDDTQSMMNISDILGSDDLVADNSEISLSRNDSAAVSESAIPMGPITLDSQVDLTQQSASSKKSKGGGQLEFSPYVYNRPSRTYVRKTSLSVKVDNEHEGLLRKTNSERERMARGAKLAEHMNFDCKVIKKPPRRTPSFEARAERGSIIADTLDFDDTSSKVAEPLIPIQEEGEKTVKSSTSIKESPSKMLKISAAAGRRTTWMKSPEVSPVESMQEVEPVKKADTYDYLNNVLNHDFVRSVQSIAQVHVSSEDLFMEVKPYSELNEKPVVKPKKTTPAMKSVDSLELYPKDERGMRHSKSSVIKKKVSFHLLTKIAKLFNTKRKRRVSFDAMHTMHVKQDGMLKRAINFWSSLGGNKKETYGCGEACTCGPQAKDICLCERTTNFVRCVVDPMKVTGYEEVLSCGNRDQIRIEVDEATCILPSDSNLCPSRLSTIVERTEERSSAMAATIKLEAKNNSQRTINSDISSLRSCDADADWYWRNPKVVVDEFKDSYDRLKPVLLENVSRESERYIFNKICSIIERNSCPSINSLYKRRSKLQEEEKVDEDRGLKKSDVVSLLMRYKRDDEPLKESCIFDGEGEDDDDDICEEFVLSVRNYTERKTEVRMESSPRRGTAVIRLDEDLRPKVSWVTKTLPDEEQVEEDDHLTSRFTLVESDITSSDSIGYCLVPNRNHQ